MPVEAAAKVSFSLPSLLQSCRTNAPPSPPGPGMMGALKACF